MSMCFVRKKGKVLWECVRGSYIKLFRGIWEDFFEEMLFEI